MPLLDLAKNMDGGGSTPVTNTSPHSTVIFSTLNTIYVTLYEEYGAHPKNWDVFFAVIQHQRRQSIDGRISACRGWGAPYAA